MNMENVNLSALWDTVLAWSPKIIGGLQVLIIGFWIVKMITRIAARSMNKSTVDADLIPFLTSLISVILKILVVITAAGVVGIEITAFAALLAGAGLAIGAAMSGTLGHFASGVMILLFKPYKIGDLVDIQGTIGSVEEIQVFNTIIHTLDNKKVIMPNGVAASGIMTNLSATGKLRVDLQVAMPYEEDFDKIKAIIKTALDKVPQKLAEEPTIEIASFNESNIMLDVRPYATDATYWDVYYNSYKEIKKALTEAGIRVPYPVELERKMA
jgi:small conductance mechanosensitive channel